MNIVLELLKQSMNRNALVTMTLLVIFKMAVIGFTDVQITTPMLHHVQAILKMNVPPLVLAILTKPSASLTVVYWMRQHVYQEQLLDVRGIGNANTELTWMSNTIVLGSMEMR